MKQVQIILIAATLTIMCFMVEGNADARAVATGGAGSQHGYTCTYSKTSYCECDSSAGSSSRDYDKTDCDDMDSDDKCRGPKVCTDTGCICTAKKRTPPKNRFGLRKLEQGNVTRDVAPRASTRIKLSRKMHILGGVNLTPWCKSKYGSRFKAKLIGKSAGDWVCEQSRGNRRSISVTSACKLQYGRKAKKSKALNWNDPYSWKCIGF